MASPSSETSSITPTSLSASHIALLPKTGSFSPPINTVKEHKDYDFYGTVSTLLTRLPAAAEFVTSNTNDAAPETAYPQVLAALTSFLNDSHTVCETPKSCCWFTIRMTKPNTEFAVPRWHQDGNYYGIDFPGQPHFPAQPRSKFATTLLGPQTLLLDVPYTPEMLTYLSSEKSDFGLSWSDDDNPVHRPKVDAYFREKGIAKVEASMGQIVRFAWGSDFAAVHSEPDMSFGDRIFVSLLFGSEEEVKHMCGFREVKFEE